MIDNLASSTIRPSFLRRLDHVGIGLAGICAVHCLATLLIVSALGLGGHFLLEENIHRFGMLLALIVATVAIGWGALRHRRPAPIMVAVIGLGFMGGALAVPHGSDELLMTLIGVLLVSLAHLLNLRTAR